MSIKRENEITIDDGPESGQCSEDEIEKLQTERKSKKHKKRQKLNKSRKRKHSDSTSSSTKTEIEFFNPYSVNTDKFHYKSEYFENFSLPETQVGDSQKFSDLLNENIIDETFNNLGRDSTVQIDNHISKFKDIPISCYEVPSKVNEYQKTIESDIIKSNRKALYLIDKTGIESTHSDLRYYLIDFGFTTSLASDVFAVLYNTASPEREQLSNHEDEVEDNEDEMFNDLPIIDASANSHESIYANSYSPEPANKIIEPYNTEQGLPISYASTFSNGSYTSSLKPVNEIIDLQVIPDVGPKDPRLNQNKPVHKFIPAPKCPPPDNCINPEKIQPKPNENNLQLNKDWEVTVANMVKTHLRLYLVHNDINKEEYKSILKRAVNKIISSGEKKLETDKISKFLHSYVIMMQKSRYLDSI